MKSHKLILIKFLLLIAGAIFFSSCANQQPPSGGEDDKTPPKIIKVNPESNTIKFTGNSIKFYFDEYVNRRSFEDAFKISPLPEGRKKFDWGAKDVEVIFENGFEKNKTYSIVITKDLRDVNGGNQLTSPMNFAFSTGDKIDKGGVAGKIFSDNLEKMIVSCYKVTSLNGNFVKPDTIKPDFITQPDEKGNYAFSNLPEGKFRLFAFNDDDRNFLYNKSDGKIALLSSDIEILDSTKLSGKNFLFKNFNFDVKSKEFIQSLKSDSLNLVFASFHNGSNSIRDNERFYFYFRNTNLSKYELADNLKLTDSASNTNVKIAFNWINDSLLQVFSPEKLKQNRTYKFSVLKLPLNFVRFFKTISESKTGTVSGSVIVSDSAINSGVNIVIQLIEKNNFSNKFTQSLTNAGAYKFENIPEGDYILFSFIDYNRNGVYDAGAYFPFEPSEPFFLYEKDLKVKGMWNTDNAQIIF